MEKQRCIGFSGPSGSGKTTLAKWLSQETGIPFIENSAGLIISEEKREELRQKYGYDQKGHAEVIRLSNAIPKFGVEFQKALLQQRVELLTNLKNEGKSFIVDRTMIDNVAYFLMQCGPHVSSQETQEYIKQAELAFNELFTHIFLVKPNENWTEDNGSRVSNNYWQNLVVYPTFRAVTRSFNLDSNLANVEYFEELDIWELEYRKSIVKHSIK